MYALEKRNITKIGRQSQRGRHIKQLKACLIQSNHVCKDTNLFAQEDVCNYFNKKLTFLSSKQLTKMKIAISFT